MDFYVSPTGSDSNAGTSSAPWLTLGKAQTFVRTLLSGQSSDIRIHIVGTLRVTTTLALVSSDNGQNGFKVVWMADSQYSGTLNAGTQITDWSVYSGGIWRAPYSGTNMRSIWVNGTRCFRSRSYGALISGLTKTSTGYTGGSGALSTEPNPSNVEFLYNVFNFSHSRNCVTSISGGTITMIQNPHSLITGSTLSAPIPYDIENLWGYFTANARPGTFYYDQANSFIYYIPRLGENLNSVYASNGLSTAISVTGSQNISFQNINVLYTTWSIETNGYASISSGFYWPLAITPTVIADNDSFYGLTIPPASILITGCTNVNLTACSIQHSDNVVLHITGQSSSCSVVGNFFYDGTTGAIFVGDQTDGPNTTVTSSITMTDNTVKRMGVNFYGANGIYDLFPSSSTYSNNWVEDMPYIGMSFGLGLNDHESWQSGLGTCTISNNRCINTNWLMQDGASIYSQAPTGGMTISGNWITYTNPMYAFGVNGDSLLASGIYLDSGSFGAAISNNVIEQTGTCLFFHNDGSLGTNTVGANYSDTSVTGGSAGITSYTVPTVTAVPSQSQNAIAVAAGPRGAYATLWNQPITAWDTLITSMTPLAWWKHNDTGSSSLDSSGNGYGLARAGSYSVSQPEILPAVERLSLGFDGSSAYEDTSVSSPFNFETGKPFSISFIVSMNMTRGEIFTAGVFAGNIDSNVTALPGWEVFIFNSTVDSSIPSGKSVVGFQLVQNNGSAEYIGYIGSFDLINGVPHIVTVTYDGSSTLQGINIYVDGYYDPYTLTTNNTITAAPTSGKNVYVGNRQNSSSGNFFQGNLGDMVIFNYELSREQVKQLYYSAAVGTGGEQAPNGSGMFALLSDL